MSAAESLGSHQLNSFAAFLEEKLHTSSENSIVQIPQLKKMADGKRPQKGGKRPEVNTAFEIPDDIYAGYCTPTEETKNERKVRIQKIERRWARERREYRYVTPKYMKKFALNPPCPRAPLAPGQIADPTSLKRGEDYPDEWAKRQGKLAKQAKEAVRNSMKTLLLLLPLLRPLLSSQTRLCQRSLRASQVLHQQCPHG